MRVRIQAALVALVAAAGMRCPPASAWQAGRPLLHAPRRRAAAAAAATARRSVNLPSISMAAAADEHGTWSSMKVAELKAECKARGLRVSGKKAELVERLVAAAGPTAADATGAGVAAEIGQDATATSDGAPTSPTMVDVSAVPVPAPAPAATEPAEAAAADKLDAVLAEAAESDKLAVVLGVFVLLEESVGANGGEGASPPPEPLLAATDALLDRKTYAAALEKRRARASVLPDEAAREAALRRVEVAQVFLAGYVAAQRRNRARQTVSEMLQKALLGPDALDSYMETLGDVDDELVEYAVELVDQEATKCGVRSPPLPGRDEGDKETIDSSVMDQRLAAGVEVGGAPNGPSGPNGNGGSPNGGSPSPLLQVLTIVRNRIDIQKQARAATKSARRRGETGPAHIQVLGRATEIESDAEREEYLRSVINSRRAARDFAEFAEDGAQFLMDKVERERSLDLTAGLDLGKSGAVAGDGAGEGEGADDRSISRKLRAEVRRASRVRDVASQIRAMVMSFPIDKRDRRGR